jgi:hypothetical protein
VDGRREGALLADGSMDSVGDTEGERLGRNDGCVDGPGEGVAVGSMDSVGDPEGEKEGDSVGDPEGVPVGLLVGL